ncbi:hypothetical protein NE237_011814 [Protea cynaroides]|uniref:Glycosyltransferase n=1 Tax=Protea cynaroides TaxID=273540 RepID=A0A9Q0GXX2_9MAGN|nr:hypothetical protein NE237_011814 [Protea cynaroides]
MKGTKQTPHILILPALGIGHLIPLIEFAKQFVRHHDFSITFTIPTDGSPTNAQKEVLDSLPKSIDTIFLIFLSPVNLDDLSKDTNVETRIYLTISLSLSSLRNAFEVLIATAPIAALVVDLFGNDAFDVVKQFNVPSYIFLPSPAMLLSLYLYLPKLDEKHSCEYRDLHEPLKLPGCIDRVRYIWTLYHSKGFRLADGVLLNGFTNMEVGAIESLKEGGDSSVPPIYPLMFLASLNWLNSQPIGLVLFVSFGSGGALSWEQLNELALGLELSKQRFLWVVKSSNTTYLGAHATEEENPLMGGGGLVVRSWAPRIQVLSHASTGGFLTHCGWNSTLESVVHGVPLIARPLFAEQKMNAVMMVEDLKVTLKPKAEKNGIVRRVEIAKVVKCLMEGDEGKRAWKRIRMLKDSATKVLSEERSSRKSISEVARKWKSQVWL